MEDFITSLNASSISLLCLPWAGKPAALCNPSHLVPSAPGTTEHRDLGCILPAVQCYFQFIIPSSYTKNPLPLSSISQLHLLTAITQWLTLLVDLPHSLETLPFSLPQIMTEQIQDLNSPRDTLTSLFSFLSYRGYHSFLLVLTMMITLGRITTNNAQYQKSSSS